MKHLPRMYDWIIVTILLTIIIYVLAPQQLPVTLYKLSLITTAAVLGYWIDRSLFPYARPDQFLTSPVVLCSLPENIRDQIKSELTPRKGCELVAAAAMQRRAIIIVGAMLAMSLGV